ncbi:holo-ACP synthase [Nitrosopumilus sp.]|uniref:holo-ACP synthase n=1 Tax=Nitrosopumilus sp. TaxID=2024843 RepID=UPI003D1061D1
MIENLGIGIDLVDIDKFKKIPFNEKQTFYTKIFTNKEIQYCLKFKEPYEHFAGKFAIKEAVKKSLNSNIDLFNIETFHENEKPQVKIKDSNSKFLISMSHEKNFSIALAISLG